MVDPLTLIVAALVNGAAAAAEGMAERAIVRGYRSLRSLVMRKYAGPAHPGLAPALDELDREPHSPVAVTHAEDELRSAGVAADAQVRALASDLMAIVSDPMAHLQADPVEDAHRRGGVQAVAQVMDRHMVSVMRVRSGFCLNDTDLLTSDIVSTGVPREESDEVVRLHGDVRDIIDRIAVQIEEGKYRDAEEAIRSMPLAHNERERASSIVAADRKLHISYQSLRVAVELFGQLNQIILDRVRRERSPDDEANLMLGNAILVYELADFVMRFIEDFAVAGGPEIASLHDETRARIAAARKAEAELGTKVAAEGIDPTIRAQTLENITQREEALDELEKEWDMYVTDVSRLHGAVDEVRGKVATLSIIRENARLQINVIQLTSLLNFLKQNSDAMDGTIEALKNLRLAPLSSNRVRRLLGLR